MNTGASDKEAPSKDAPLFGKYLTPIAITVLIYSLIPPIVAFAYMLQWNYNAPFMDEWDALVDPALKAANGTLTLKDLLWPHNEHRIFFARAFTAVMAYFGVFDARHQRYLSQFLVLVSWLTLSYAYWRIDKKFAWLAVPVFSILLYSLRQNVNFATGIHSTHFFAPLWMFLGILALITLDTSWRSLAILIVMAIFASISNSNGLAAWVVLGVGMWLRGWRDWKHYAVWAAVGLSIIAWYFTGFNSSGNSSVSVLAYADTYGWLAAFRLVIRFGLSLLGALYILQEPFTHAGALTGGATLTITLLNCYWLWRKENLLTVLILPVCLTLMALGSIGLVALGRASLYAFEPAYAYDARYVTASLPLWLALAVSTLLLLGQLDYRRSSFEFGAVTIYSVLLSILVLAQVAYCVLLYPQKTLPYDRESVECLKQGGCQSDFYPYASRVDNLLPQLRAHGFSPYTRQDITEGQ